MKTKTLLVLFFISAFCLGLNAQENEKRFGFELSTGASVATQKLGGAELNPGFGVEGIFHYRFLPHTGVYGGWGLNKHTAETSFAGTDFHFEETGYVLGLQYKNTFGDSPLGYYFRAGGLYNHIEVENPDGDATHDSKHGLGWQLAGGLDVALGNNWSLTPGLKFNYLNREVENNGVDIPLEMRYVQVRFGIVKRF